MDLASVANELYGLLPSEFTAARDAQAITARRAGNRELAAEIKGLRRPTTSAWLANRLVREGGEGLARVFELAGALRLAQAELAAEELRRLSRRRHQVIGAVVDDARRLGLDTKQPVSDAVVAELTATLEAALADVDAEAALRSGRLTTGLSYSGLGPVDVDGAVAAPATEQADKEALTEEHRPQKRGGTGDKKRRLQEAEQAAQSAAIEAERRESELDEQHRRIQELVRSVHQEVTELEKQLAEARAAQKQAAKQLRATEAEHTRAEKALQDARGRAAQAQAAIKSHRGD